MKKEEKALIFYRIEQSDESLQSAEILFASKKYRPAVNRAYYAMFYSTLAIMVISNHDIAKHSGVISIFDKEYVKKGLFDKTLSKWLHEAFDLRQRADYTEMFFVSSDRAKEIIENARNFNVEIKKYLDKIIP